MIQNHRKIHQIAGAIKYGNVFFGHGSERNSQGFQFRMNFREDGDQGVGVKVRGKI